MEYEVLAAFKYVGRRCHEWPKTLNNRDDAIKTTSQFIEIGRIREAKWLQP